MRQNQRARRQDHKNYGTFAFRIPSNSADPRYTRDAEACAPAHPARAPAPASTTTAAAATAATGTPLKFRSHFKVLPTLVYTGRGIYTLRPNVKI